MAAGRLSLFPSDGFDSALVHLYQLCEQAGDDVLNPGDEADMDAADWLLVDDDVTLADYCGESFFGPRPKESEDRLWQESEERVRHVWRAMTCDSLEAEMNREEGLEVEEEYVSIGHKAG